MAEYSIKSETLTAIADAIRAKDGTTEPIKTVDMAIRIEAIEVGGGGGEIDALIDGSITEISSNVASVKSYAAYGAKSLTSISLPMATSLGERAFYECTILAEAYVPLVTTIGAYVFGSCPYLTKIKLPNLVTMAANAFRTCSRLIMADMGSVTTIMGNSFTSCNDFKALILRKTDAITTLYNGNAITSTLIGSGKGYIYVPSALIDTYKAATNWSTFAAQFRALEDYTVDGTVTGELDESKI